MFTKNTNILLSISITLSVLSLVVFFLVFNIIKNKDKNASDLSIKIQEKITEEENLLQFKNVIKETNEKHQILKSYVVDQGKIDEFVAFLEAQGDAVLVPIDIKNVEISKTDPNILAVLFDGEGAFENIIHLIWVIDNAPYKITLKNIHLTAVPDFKWLFNANIEVISH